MESSAEIRFHFDRAWLLRLNQKLDEALIAYAQLKDPVFAAAIPEYNFELKVLGASLSRARGDIALARAVIVEVEHDHALASTPLSSRLLVERALNHFYSENYSAAFDDFLNVVARSAQETNRVLVAQATLNALLCAEYLGLSPDSLEKSYVQIRKQVDVDISGVDSQWQAYQIRRLWAFGEFEKIQLPKRPVWNQATYHVQFLKMLPFIDEAILPGEDLADCMRSQPEPYLRSYWLRTLIGQSRTEDLMINKVSEFSERIYLWTWLWLAGGEIQLEKIVPYIEELLNRMPELHLTQLDQELIHLSLGWISAFCPRYEVLKNRVLSQFSTLTRARVLPFIEYERLIQGCVENRLKGVFDPNNAFVKMVQMHPLHQARGHHFAGLLSSLDDLAGPVSNKMRGLLNKIEQKLAEERDFQQSEIAVDLEKMAAVNKLTGEKITSEPICLALQLLSTQSSVGCAEFVEIVFHQNGYDDYLHSARIFNLLARIRSFLPENLAVTKKSDRIFTRGDWAIVKIKKNSDKALPIRRSSEKILAKSASPVGSSRNRQMFEKLTKINRAKFNRQDVEKKLQLSRAAAHRLVREWLQSGMVECLGSGPARKYSVSEKWKVMHT